MANDIFDLSEWLKFKRKNELSGNSTCNREFKRNLHQVTNDHFYVQQHQRQKKNGKLKTKTKGFS